MNALFSASRISVAVAPGKMPQLASKDAMPTVKARCPYLSETHTHTIQKKASREASKGFQNEDDEHKKKREKIRKKRKENKKKEKGIVRDKQKKRQWCSSVSNRSEKRKMMSIYIYGINLSMNYLYLYMRREYCKYTHKFR